MNRNKPDTNKRHTPPVNQGEPDDVVFRKALIRDVPEIVNLINHYAQKGEMLPRSRSNVYEQIRNFMVVEKNGEIVATGALDVVWETLGEIRSVAVKETEQGKSYGRKLVELLLDEAIFLGLSRIFILTYRTGFFAKLGFKTISKETLPHKVWKDCLNCPKFPDCDETAMAIDLLPPKQRRQASCFCRFPTRDKTTEH